MLGLVEEERRADQQEIAKMREQTNIFQKEYMFYKDLSERLESRGTLDM